MQQGIVLVIHNYIDVPKASGVCVPVYRSVTVSVSVSVSVCPCPCLGKHFWAGTSGQLRAGDVLQPVDLPLLQGLISFIIVFACERIKQGSDAHVWEALISKGVRVKQNFGGVLKEGSTLQQSGLTSMEKLIVEEIDE
jgi:hypothetical protein